MKKFILAIAILTLSTMNTFAQSAWEVFVEWEVTSSSTCQFQDLANDRFLVAITIIDEANNDQIVVNNATNIEPNDATSSTFDVQQALQAHCNDTTLANAPSYKIFTAVRMVNIQTHYVYCFEKDPGTVTNCYEMSQDGCPIPLIYFN